MGIDVLLDSWAARGGELPPGSTLLVVGDGPLAGELEARAARPPLAGSVRLLGRVRDRELVEVYRAADVAVLPTLAVEGFGLVVLEAAACGTPSIVTDVGGLSEAAAPLDRSLVVPAADAGALADRLRAAAARAPAGSRGHPPLRRALLLAGPRAAPPRAVPPAGGGRARRAPARRLRRPRRPALGRRDRAAAAAALPARRPART